MELATSVETWRYRGLEARYRCNDGEAWRLELCRRAADLRDAEVFASRALEARCSRADVEVWSAGGGLQA